MSCKRAQAGKDKAESHCTELQLQLETQTAATTALRQVWPLVYALYVGLLYLPFVSDTCLVYLPLVVALVPASGTCPCTCPVYLPFVPTLCVCPLYLPSVPTLDTWPWYWPWYLPFVPALCACPLCLPLVPAPGTCLWYLPLVSALCICPLYLPLVPALACRSSRLSFILCMLCWLTLGFSLLANSKPQCLV